MNQQLHPYPNQHKTWQWPFDLTQYDRNPVLSETESAELNRQFWLRHQVRSQNKTVLHRLVQPIDDVLTFLNASDNIRRDTIRFMIIAIHRRGTPFWAWSVEEWVEILCPTATAFNVSYGRRTSDYHNDNRARRIFPIIAYLLCSLPTIEPLLHLVAIHPLARKVFGDEAVNEAVQQLTTILKSWGYHLKHTMDYFTGCICYLLLQNRSPYLEDLTSEFLELAQQTCTITCVRTNIYRISRGLSALGITNKPLPTSGLTMPEPVDSSVSMSEEWLSWCQRWREQSPQPSHKSDYNPLLQVGRWLKVSHPEVTSPAHWTYELAAEFVAMVSDMKVGDWIDQNNHLCVKSDRIGQPMRPNTKAKMLKAMRVFLRDCQDWGWIPVQLNPYRALGTPHSLKKLIGPDPQVIDKEFWAKILWAAMNLQADDLLSTRSDAHIYPLELVRAIAMVWCFTALRSNEIWRLRVGCIRWQTEDVLVPETGGILPRDAVCFLDIPVNKTMTSYTKAVHPLVGKRINEWERVRPQEQPHVMDRKTSETVQFLFSYRGVHISKEYINHSLIPLLCRKAGIPEQDSRGTITSHRARATIASMLYNAKEPLNIFELKEYLGHNALSSTQHYVRVDPTKLASRVAKAGYLEQNMATIEVLLDQEAVMRGAAARGEVWKYYDLGHGYCTNTFWAECKHRMACARCPFYRPKNSTMDQLVEGKANLVRMLEFIKLTEDEQLLVTEGIELHQALIDKLADMPTPAGPTPRELEASRQDEVTVIPIKTVQRSTRKNQPKQDSSFEKAPSQCTGGR